MKHVLPFVMLLFTISITECVAAEPLATQDSRRDAMLRSMVAHPYPSEGAWRTANFCLAAYWLNEKTTEADAEILRLRQARVVKKL